MPHPSITSGAALSAALLLLLGACDSNGPSTSTNALSQVQATDLGADVSQDVDDLADLSVFDATGGVPFAVGRPGTQSVPPPPCVSVTPVPLVHSDADILPDSARLDFSECAFSRGNGTVTDSLDGTIDFLDPLPLAASIGVRHVFTNLTRKRDNTAFPLRSFESVHNGVREWGGNTDTLGHTITNFVTVWTHPSTRTTTHTRNWVAKFTAATPGSISILTPLPAGTFTVNGTGSWTTANRSWSIVTSTVTPLAYDPTCSVAPRFTAGELSLVVTRNGETTNVSIVFTACGQFTVTRTPVA